MAVVAGRGPPQLFDGLIGREQGSDVVGRAAMSVGDDRLGVRREEASSVVADPLAGDADRRLRVPGSELPEA